MPRMHGEHKRDHAARLQFEAERKARPAEISAERVEVPIACHCPWRAYPHIVTEESRVAHARAQWRDSHAEVR